MRSIAGLAAAMLTLDTASMARLDERPLDLLELDAFNHGWRTGRPKLRLRRAVPRRSRSKYVPHIGAKQRGKYPPNMPLHVTGWQRRAELEAWNAEMDRKYGRNQEAPLALAA